jgi:hypothetical protein
MVLGGVLRMARTYRRGDGKSLGFSCIHSNEREDRSARKGGLQAIESRTIGEQGHSQNTNGQEKSGGDLKGSGVFSSGSAPIRQQKNAGDIEQQLVKERLKTDERRNVGFLWRAIRARELSALADPQTAIPAIAKDSRLIGLIEEAVKRVPAQHDLRQDRQQRESHHVRMVSEAARVESNCG